MVPLTYIELRKLRKRTFLSDTYITARSHGEYCCQHRNTPKQAPPTPGTIDTQGRWTPLPIPNMPELHFSRNSLLNTVLRNGQGNPVYRIESPFKCSNRVTTISRFATPLSSEKASSMTATAHHPSPAKSALVRDAASAGRWSRSATSKDQDQDILQLAGLEEHVVAKILWHCFKQSVFTIGGDEITLKAYMPKTNWWRSTRAFTAKNGQKYKWIEGTFTCWLKRDDGSGTVVARYHRRCFTIFTKGRRSRLDVADELMPILDEVVMSFIYFERKREQHERQRGG